MSYLNKKPLLDTFVLSINQKEAVMRVLQAGADGLPIAELDDLFQSHAVSRKTLEMFGAAYNSETQKLSTGINDAHLYNLYEKSNFEFNNSGSKYGFIEFEHAIATTFSVHNFIAHKATVIAHIEGELLCF